MDATANLHRAFRQGVGLLHAGRWQEAEALHRQFLVRWPGVPELHHNLGMALKYQGRSKEAIAAFEAAIALHPGFVPAYNNLGTTLQQMRETVAAIAAFRRAVDLEPESLAGWNNLGIALKDVGRLDEAIAAFQRTLSVQPAHAVSLSNLLCTIHFHPDYDAPALYRQARQWNDLVARQLAAEITAHLNEASPQRRLRVGYVSPDFRHHCQSLFTPPLLSNHDHQHFEIFCYSSAGEGDAVTARLQRYADQSRDITRLDDAQAAKLIRYDKIDILVDLTLHMTASRLGVFARKPAPIQVTWLGYPGTTGLEAIDYRLTDPRLDPVGEQIRNPKSEIRINDQNSSVPIPNGAPNQQKPLRHSDIGSLGFDSDFGLRISDFATKEPHYSELSVRLPDTFWCYDPGGMEESLEMPMPEPNSLPALTAGHITLGCLNNFCKINDRLLQLWVPVIGAIPDCHLILLAPPGPHRQEIAGKLGLGEDRLHFVPIRPRRQYLETYHRIDLCLDTLPANGHTTSLDALWMGVPVVTRVGQTALGRAGLSQLYQLKLLDLVAQSDEQFVNIAIGLARDLNGLKTLRAGLRARMEQSPLMDGPRFARNVESAFRQMWQSWCEARRRKDAGRGPC